MKIFPFALAFIACISISSAQSAAPDLVLHGKITSTQNKTWTEATFQVPAGVHRISVDFSYTGKENETALDLGIADPQRFRGYSKLSSINPAPTSNTRNLGVRCAVWSWTTSE